MNDSIEEGQFLNGKCTGWTRTIYSDGKYVVDWCKNGEAYGYVINYKNNRKTFEGLRQWDEI